MFKIIYGMTYERYLEIMNEAFIEEEINDNGINRKAFNTLFTIGFFIIGPFVHLYCGIRNTVDYIKRMSRLRKIRRNFNPRKRA